MSKLSEAVIKCDNCGHTFDEQVYSSVNAQQNPELKQKIHDSSLFTYHCDQCGNFFNSVHSVLYHDVEKQFMVWLVPPDQRNILFLQSKSLQVGGLLPNYRLHISRYPFQWAERITTLESGLDPRIVELYKFQEKVEQNHPLKTQNDFIHFIKYTRKLIGRTRFHWKFVYDNGDIEQSSEPMNAGRYKSAEELVNNLEPTLNSTKWHLVDWQFPFGLEIMDGELIQLPETSDFIEFGEERTPLPNQFLEVLQRTGKGTRQ